MNCTQYPWVVFLIRCIQNESISSFRLLIDVLTPHLFSLNPYHNNILHSLPVFTLHLRKGMVLMCPNILLSSFFVAKKGCLQHILLSGFGDTSYLIRPSRILTYSKCLVVPFLPVSLDNLKCNANPWILFAAKQHR
jgi:hypothetical protein